VSIRRRHAKMRFEGPDRQDLSYIEGALSPDGVYTTSATSYIGMCTVYSGATPFLSGNTTLCPVVIESVTPTAISAAKSLVAMSAINIRHARPRQQRPPPRPAARQVQVHRQ
jgi:hypothetical protein